MLRHRQAILRLIWHFIALSALVFLLNRCSSEGQSGNLSLATSPGQQAAQDATQNLIDLYRTALRQEDIDRLQELLQPMSASGQGPLVRQAEDEVFTDAETFLENMSSAFRNLTFLDLQTLVQQDDIEVEGDVPRATFFEIESVLDPTRREQRTHASHTIFRLIKQETRAENDAEVTTTFRIAAVTRQGPQFQIVTPGPLQAGVPATIRATETTGTFSLAEVTLETCEATAQKLVETDGLFQGVFTPLGQPETQSLRVCFHGTNPGTDEEQIVVTHRYRVRLSDDGMVQKIAGTGATQFFAVAIAPDGTVTGGGLEPGFGATLYQAPFGDTTACLVGSPFFQTNLGSRVEDLVYDNLGRLHTIIFDKGSANPQGPSPIVGDFLVFDAQDSDDDPFLLCASEHLVFCQTVNAFDPDQNYPLLVQDPETDAAQPSSATRIVKAEGNAVWLYGADGGVVRVTDSVQEGLCPERAVEVQYEPLFRRQNSDLLSNSVPAFVVGSDGSLGFGTALGFTLRLPTGQFIPVPFQRQISVPPDPDTLEAFFRQVAEAIFNARPLTTEGIGNISFQELFGSSIVKEDFIFAAVEEERTSDQVPRRFWLGTLGGGLRRLEAHNEGFRDTLLLTRAQVERIDPDSGERTVVLSPGISSNIIFALAVDSSPPSSEDGDDVHTIWAATDEGVSRIHVRQETVTVTNFSALDGLELPVRDVAIDGGGSVWLATDRGLFRIVQ